MQSAEMGETVEEREKLICSEGVMRKKEKEKEKERKKREEKKERKKGRGGGGKGRGKKHVRHRVHSGCADTCRSIARRCAY